MIKNLKGYSCLLILIGCILVNTVCTKADENTNEELYGGVEIDLPIYQLGYLGEEQNYVETFDVDENEVLAQEAILNSLNNLDDEVNLREFNLSLDIVKKICAQVVNYQPEFFYFKNFTYYYIPSTNVVTRIVWNYIDYTKDDIQSMRARYQEKLNEALSWIKSDMNANDKIMAVHEYLTLHSYYSNKAEWSNGQYTAYNILVNGSGLCQAYALAFNGIMKELGIDSLFVASQTLNHAWNLVNVDGEWYHVDVTWDDNSVPYSGFSSHINVLQSDSGIRNSGHSTWETITPEANDNRYDNIYWKKVDKGLTYYMGNWYYPIQGAIIKNNLIGTGQAIFENDLFTYNSYIVSWKDNWYFNSNNLLIQYFPENDNLKIIQQYDYASEIFNMGIWNDALFYYKIHFSEEKLCKEDLPLKNYQEKADVIEERVLSILRESYGRIPEENAIYWIQELKTGQKTLADLMNTIFTNEKFTDNNFTFKKYVDILYKGLLNRNSDPEGERYWLDLLEGGVSTNYVLRGFINSIELEIWCHKNGILAGKISVSQEDMNSGNRVLLLKRCYRYLLGREADVEEILYYENRLLNEKVYVVIRDIYRSKECQKRNMSDEMLIEALYRALLDRMPEKEGFHYYINKLMEDYKRETVVADFVQSDEFRNKNS